MTAGHTEKNGQRDTDEDSHAPEHSQTLPMITEEIAASRATSLSAPTSHATTPVLPPNPIRTTVHTAAEAAQSPKVAETVQSPKGDEIAESPKEDEKKSEGRISATQLIAGAGAAATSSVIGGQLGVAGTVVGAGIASIVTALAVTLYGRSLDKGKEKIQQVGSKLAPAVKAKIAKNPAAGSPAAGTTAAGDPAPVDPSLAVDTAFAPPESADANPTAASARDGDFGTDDEDSASTAGGEHRSWWQNLRRKRVLYPVTIGVAAFGIGLGGVVMAESFTDADISPGTSQISRSVSGQSTTPEDTGTNSGGSDSATSGDGSGSGSGSGADSGRGATDSTGRGTNDQSTSAGETGSQGTESGQTDQGADTSTNTGADTGSTASEAEGTAAGSSSTGTDSGGSTGSTGDTSGGANGSAGSGGTGSDGGTGGSAGSGTGGSANGSGGGSAASAQG